MKRICAWCKKDMGTKPVVAGLEDTVTHGICPACLETYFQMRQSTLIEVLDRLDAPVVVVDSSVCVRCANKQAQALLHKGLPDIEGVVVGDVLECAYAKSTGGCGNTTHCDGCTIRNTVMDTFQTGESHRNIPAHLLQGGTDSNQEVNLVLSTEKINDIVLLKVEVG